MAVFQCNKLVSSNSNLNAHSQSNLIGGKRVVFIKAVSESRLEGLHLTSFAEAIASPKPFSFGANSISTTLPETDTSLFSCMEGSGKSADLRKFHLIFKCVLDQYGIVVL